MSERWTFLRQKPDISDINYLLVRLIGEVPQTPTRFISRALNYDYFSFHIVLQSIVSDTWNGKISDLIFIKLKFFHFADTFFHFNCQIISNIPFQLSNYNGIKLRLLFIPHCPTIYNWKFTKNSYADEVNTLPKDGFW